MATGVGTGSGGRSSRHASKQLPRGPRIGIVWPITLLALVVLGSTLLSREVLGDSTAARENPIGAAALYVAAAALLVAVGTVAVLLSARTEARFAGPEYRLIQSLRRMRSGDLSFRVHLRRGDPLGGLAEECNALLEWLNRNPPVGASTGTDVVEVESLDADAAVEVAQ